MHYEILGRTESEAPTMLLSAGLGGAGRFWGPQLAALEQTHRIILYDHLGTGGSPAMLPDDYTIDDMAGEALALLDQLEIEHVDFMGHALGGLVGLQMALLAPARIGRLVVVNAWSRVDVQSERCFRVRLALLEDSGVQPYLHAQPLFLYPADWLSEHHDRLLEEEAQALVHFPGKANVTARIAALRAFDIDTRLAEIASPTLVVAARDDLLVPYTRSERLAAGLPHARLALFDYGGHGLTVTVPEAFNAAVAGFLATETR
ncbi:pyrimidine utilization protein D [Salinicola avicenniae]|uniref:pyrimidine utilization protein D n=1 Tax=Salinicola avicenniae TaxID=2916836 RepID=UPI002074A143|nr:MULTISPECIES: pyrimidine utilization protein D [unclassified Salinicola]